MAYSSSELDQLSASWQLESDYPLFRGAASLVVAVVSLVLLISLIIKIRNNAKVDPQNKPDVCKYCTICCGAHFTCTDLFVLPAPLDVCICLYLLTFLTYLCNAYGILKYGNWIKAAQDPIGKIALIIFAVLVGLISLCVYLYFYSMLILTVACAGDEFRISRWKRRMHKTLMLISAVCLPAGNIMMEVYGTDYGRTFRIGQQLAYVSFACIFLGICHLTTLLGKKLEMILANAMSWEVISPRHSKTRTQISRAIDSISEAQEQRDSQLIQVITKLIVIALTILIISTGTGIMTGVRYYFGYDLVLARYLSLARWFWFTIVNIAIGCFVVYLTIGFNIELYKYWCRCDGAVHKCVMCCVKRDAIRRVSAFQSKRSVGFQSSSSPPPEMASQNTITPLEIASPEHDLVVSFSSMNATDNNNMNQTPNGDTQTETGATENQTNDKAV
eukprot:21204_1